MNGSYRYLLFAVLLLAPGLVSSAQAAVPPEPTYAPAYVDGFAAEWNLATDFFASMYRAGNPAKLLESKAYLRYDCVTSTLYVLVLNEPGVVGLADTTAGAMSWVAINSQSNKCVTEKSGNDGTPPDFAWVGAGYDGDPIHNRGYEASFALAPGDYNIIIHTEVFDGTGQTSATIGFPGTGPALSIYCAPVETREATWGGVKTIYR